VLFSRVSQKSPSLCCSLIVRLLFRNAARFVRPPLPSAFLLSEEDSADRAEFDPCFFFPAGRVSFKPPKKDMRSWSTGTGQTPACARQEELRNLRPRPSVHSSSSPVKSVHGHEFKLGQMISNYSIDPLPADVQTCRQGGRYFLYVQY